MVPAQEKMLNQWTVFESPEIAAQVTRVVKNMLANEGNTRDAGLTPGSRRSPGSGRSPGVGNGHLLQCACLEKFPGQRRQVAYSPTPWGPKESDMTEHEHDIH